MPRYDDGESEVARERKTVGTDGPGQTATDETPSSRLVPDTPTTTADVVVVPVPRPPGRPSPFRLRNAAPRLLSPVRHPSDPTHGLLTSRESWSQKKKKKELYLRRPKL